MTSEQEWEQVLQIKTAGRNDSRSDTEHHPYEPTDYCVLERLANSGHIRKKHTLIDYGSGKGRVSIFMAYQTGCHSIGIEYDERLYEKALLNGESPAAHNSDVKSFIVFENNVDFRQRFFRNSIMIVDIEWRLRRGEQPKI